MAPATNTEEMFETQPFATKAVAAGTVCIVILHISELATRYDVWEVNGAQVSAYTFGVLRLGHDLQIIHDKVRWGSSPGKGIDL